MVIESHHISSLQRYARATGALYLAIIILALLKTTGIDSSLIVHGDILQTVENIKENETLFRIGIVALLIMYAGVVALSGTLYVVLKKVDEKLALIAMLFRTAEGVLGGMTALLSLLVLSAVKADGGTTELAQVLTGQLLDVSSASIYVVLTFVGIGGTLFCYLFYMSRYVPRVLSAWGIFTYLSMLFLAVVSILYPEHPMVLGTVLYGSGTLFELFFGAWLLVKGVNVS